MTVLVLRKLIPASGTDLETRARCQDDGHPVGAVNHTILHGKPVSVCHCGRIWRPGVHPIHHWPRPPVTTKRKPVGA